MKKIKYLIAGFVFLASISFPQSQSITKTITVTTPGGGTVWAKDTAHTIEWRFTGEIDGNVKIRLFRGSNRIKSITNSTPTNNRSFRCPPNIFNDVPDGDYSIRVKTVDNNFSDNSDIFTIGIPPTTSDNNTIPDKIPGNIPHPLVDLAKKRYKTPNLNRNVNLPPPSIKITFPPKNHNWRLKLGNTSLPFPIRVLWLKTGVGNQDLRVKIFLRRVVNGVQTTLLTQNTPNDGLWRGEISRDLRSSLYTIVIQTLDGKIRVESDTFYITNAENDPN